MEDSDGSAQGLRLFLFPKRLEGLKIQGLAGTKLRAHGPRLLGVVVGSSRTGY